MAKKSKKYEDSHFEEHLETQTIVNVDIEKRMKEAFIDYAMSVIMSRALPDVRDGLKPVHRRILYSMYEENLTSDKPFFKSATTVGNVIGRYHPHGDASVYDAMVRMAQDFSMRYPLIDGHGNFGSVDGDPPAAYRYTEARMSKIANVLLENIDKNTVDFIPNFDEKRREPVVLPTRIPTLLVNGSSGIAVGMATEIPPHNLTEVLNGVIAQIEDPEITVEELMEYIKGPDFPTKGTIMGRSGIRSAYATGKGRIIIRAKAQIEEHKNGTASIIVTELPYKVNKKDLVESIANLVKDKKIDGLDDIDDHSSDRVGIRLEIFLKRDANPQVVLNQLYKYSRLQDSFSINMIAIDNGRPKTMNLKEILDRFICFQEEIVTRRTQFDLEKAEARMHILEGLRLALANIDEIINIIRNSYDNAKENLIARFGFSEIQAQSVLDMRLVQLQKLNGEKIDNEYSELEERTEEYRVLLSDKKMLLEQIKKELIEIRDRYGDERETQIENIVEEIEDEDLIEKEDCVITMTHYGYVKRTVSSTYKSQHRGGRGVSGLQTREEDFVEYISTASTHDYIMFFTNKGRAYKLKGYQIPESGRQAKGSAIINLLPVEKDEKITAMIPVSEFSSDKYLTMLTKKGIIKKTSLDCYGTARKGGLIAIVIDEDDELIGVNLTDGENDIMVGTNKGMVIRFNESDVRPLGRVTRGVKAITLREGDYVVGMANVDDESELMIVTENGFGKKTEFDLFKTQKRSGMGLIGYKTSDKTGNVIGVTAVNASDDLMLIASDGVIIRMYTEEINSIGRATSGVRLMRPGDGVKVIGLAKTAHEEEEEADTVESEPGTEE